MQLPLHFTGTYTTCASTNVPTWTGRVRVNSSECSERFIIAGVSGFRSCRKARDIKSSLTCTLKYINKLSSSFQYGIP